VTPIVFSPVLAAAVSVGLAQFALAELPADGAECVYAAPQLVCPECLLRGCCNNYCGKPIPCQRPFCDFCCVNCYCRKPCPCVPCYCRSCSGSCYCDKPFPCMCRPIAADYYSCPVGCSGCAKWGCDCQNAASSDVRAETLTSGTVRLETD
jgi:hypothetical protein